MVVAPPARTELLPISTTAAAAAVAETAVASSRQLPNQQQQHQNHWQPPLQLQQPQPQPQPQPSNQLLRQQYQAENPNRSPARRPISAVTPTISNFTQRPQPTLPNNPYARNSTATQNLNVSTNSTTTTTTTTTTATAAATSQNSIYGAAMVLNGRVQRNNRSTNSNSNATAINCGSGVIDLSEHNEVEVLGTAQVATPMSTGPVPPVINADLQVTDASGGGAIITMSFDNLKELLQRAITNESLYRQQYNKVFAVHLRQYAHHHYFNIDKVRKKEKKKGEKKVSHELGSISL